jgi:hypothetical protein
MELVNKQLTGIVREPEALFCAEPVSRSYKRFPARYIGYYSNPVRGKLNIILIGR